MSAGWAARAPEDHQQRKSDGVGQQQLLLGIMRARHAACLFDVERVFAARLARAQHVEADARDDRRQPRAEVVHTAPAAPAEPQPPFLHRIVCLGERAEHPIRHAAQVAAFFFELFRQRVVVGHLSHFLVPLRQGYDG
jgi:hypothetical protein